MLRRARVSALSSTDPEARAAAARKAGRARDAGAIPALLAMLGDETPITAMRAVPSAEVGAAEEVVAGSRGVSRSRGLGVSGWAVGA